MNTPRKAIKEHCKECVSGDLSLCASPDCKLYHYKRTRSLSNPPLSIMKAIKAQCFECTGYEIEETKNCTDKKCNLYPYRMGKNPKNKGASAEHLKKIRTSPLFLKSQAGT